jgi:hypothetical protein
MPPDIRIRFGRAIRRLRETQKINQEEARCGLHRTYFAFRESNRNVANVANSYVHWNDGLSGFRNKNTCLAKSTTVSVVSAAISGGSCRGATDLSSVSGPNCCFLWKCLKRMRQPTLAERTCAHKKAGLIPFHFTGRICNHTTL